MSESRRAGVATLVEEAVTGPGAGERLAHLVLKQDWPIALCGANVSEHLGTGAPAMDRCVDCLKAAAARGLGRPGWSSGT